MRSMEGDEPSKGATGWFLGKLFRNPAGYIGLAAGVGVAISSLLAAIPLGGAIGLGALVGGAVGMLSFLIGYGIQASHRKALESEENAPTDDFSSKELVENLQKVGENEAASVLEKLVVEHEETKKLSRELLQGRESGEVLKLVTPIMVLASSEAEELEDLARRANDPLLESPEDSDARREKIRAELIAAYRTMADARSRLRRGEKLSQKDYLGGENESDLSALTERLAEETEIAERVEARMEPDFGNIVFSETENEDDDSNAGEESGWERNS